LTMLPQAKYNSTQKSESKHNIWKIERQATTYFM
jgi:hypothetical protein